MKGGRWIGYFFKYVIYCFDVSGIHSLFAPNVAGVCDLGVGPFWN